jgi:hypothetical protein
MSDHVLQAPREIRVTVAIGATLIVQTALGLLWAGAAAERIAQLEKRADASAEIIERTARPSRHGGSGEPRRRRRRARRSRQ